MGRETDCVILVICILTICLAASLQEGPIREQIYKEQYLESGHGLQGMMNYEHGDSKLEGHTLLLICAFVRPERRWDMRSPPF